VDRAALRLDRVARLEALLGLLRFVEVDVSYVEVEQIRFSVGGSIS